MADDKDYIKGWTIQQGAAPAAPESVPGTVITADELPDQQVLKDAGVDVDQLFAGLVIVADEDEREAVRLGKENVTTTKPQADEKQVEEPKTESKAETKDEKKASDKK